MKVLHYKTNFLNPSETFISRLIQNHTRFTPLAMCIHKEYFTKHLEVYQQPQEGLNWLINTVCFHLNLSLPFYRHVIESTSPDIIHAHFGFDGFRMYRVARETNTPLVVSFYGSDVSRLPNEFDWKRRYKKLAANAQKFIAASQLMKLQLIELGFPEDKIEIIRFGVDIQKFSFNNVTNTNNRILMIGRMVEKKGFRFALQALKVLKDRGKTVNIDLYGDGPLRTDLENLTTRLGLQDQVFFHGFVSNKKVRDVLQNHSILLVPSVTASDDDEEGLPNTILEAMASGVPVIASDHAAISEAVIHQETGLLVPEGQPKAVADALEKLLTKAIDIDEIKKNARNLIEKEYSVKQLVKSTESVYLKTIRDYEKQGSLFY